MNTLMAVIPSSLPPGTINWIYTLQRGRNSPESLIIYIISYSKADLIPKWKLVMLMFL